MTSPAAESETFRRCSSSSQSTVARRPWSQTAAARGGRCAQAAASAGQPRWGRIPSGQAAAWLALGLDLELRRKPDLVRKLGGRGGGKEGPDPGVRPPGGPMRPDERSRRLAGWCEGPGARRAGGGRERGPEVGRGGGRGSKRGEKRAVTAGEALRVSGVPMLTKREDPVRPVQGHPVGGRRDASRKQRTSLPVSHPRRPFSSSRARLPWLPFAGPQQHRPPPSRAQLSGERGHAPQARPLR